MGINIFNYNGNDITFQSGDGSVMVNMTEVSKSFPDKNLSDIVKSKGIQDYINTIAKRGNLSLADLLIIKRGGNNPGTWMHQKVALRVSQHLSTDFAIWCDERIEELTTVGMTALPQTLDDMINNPDLVIQLATKVKELRAENEKALSMVAEKEQVIEEQKPKVEFADRFITSEDLISVVEFANILCQNGFKTGQNRLFNLLSELKFIYRNNQRAPWLPYSHQTPRNLILKEYSYERNYKMHLGNKLLITAHGQALIIKKIFKTHRLVAEKYGEFIQNSEEPF